MPAKISCKLLGKKYPHPQATTSSKSEKKLSGNTFREVYINMENDFTKT